jgi:hypothetical protein
MPIAGMPISSSGTPSAASSLAIARFSSWEKATPADCSPSRRVVSSMTRVRGVAAFMAKLAESCYKGLSDNHANSLRQVKQSVDCVILTGASGFLQD